MFNRHPMNTAPELKFQTINTQDGVEVNCYSVLTSARDEEGDDRKRKEIIDRVENRTTVLRSSSSRLVTVRTGLCRLLMYYFESVLFFILQGTDGQLKSTASLHRL